MLLPLNLKKIFFSLPRPVMLSLAVDHKYLWIFNKRVVFCQKTSITSILIVQTVMTKFQWSPPLEKCLNIFFSFLLL